MAPETRYNGHNRDVPARSSPYPTSRLAPVHDLVDLAAQIETADHMISAVTSGKLETIAEQIRNLQAQARRILQEAHESAELHRAQCRFAKRPGAIYHLYRRSDDTLYFSLLHPSEWRSGPPHAFVASYLLQADMSWQACDGTATQPSKPDVRALLGLTTGNNV